MKTCYVVQWDFCDWDDYSIRTIFVTDNKKTAKDYIKKGNRILKKYRKYYSKLYYSIIDCDDMKNHPRWNDCRAIDKIHGLTKGQFIITETNFR